MCRRKVVLSSRVADEADDGEGEGGTVLHAAGRLRRPLRIPQVRPMAGPLRWHGMLPYL